jgi:tetratricopeptide (TPR) repeat protein
MEEEGSISEVEHDEFFSKVDSLIASGKLGKALEFMKNTSDKLSAEKDIIVHVLYLIKIGQINILKVQWEDAKNHFKQAEEIIDSNLDKGPLWEKLAQKLYVEFGNMYWRLADYLKAELYLEKAISIAKEEDVAKAKAHIEMGNIKGERGELQEAVENYYKAINILERLGEKTELSRAFNNISDAYFKKGNYDWAVAYADKCIELNKELGRPRNLAIGYLTGAEALVKIGDIEDAREYHKLSSEAIKDIDDDYVKGCLSNVLGMIETEEENFKKAEKAFKKAQKLLKNTDIPFYLARAYYENGILYQNMDEFTKAREVFIEALKIFDEHQCAEEANTVKLHLKEMKEKEEDWQS